MSDSTLFVNLFRNAAPYINAFRGRTFVLALDGEAIADPAFTHLVHDFALLNSLGIRLVLCYGTRPQIEQRLRERGARIQYVNNLRITDAAALICVKEAAGYVRMEIEALLSMGLANSPMAGSRIRAASGNFITARPLGIREGVDYGYTGEVRRIDSDAIRKQLDDGAVVLLSPTGCSPTGEVFNLSLIDVATSTAIALQADKLIFLTNNSGLKDARRRLIRELTPAEADKISRSKRRTATGISAYLRGAVNACRQGVRRIHIIDRRIDGALLQEFFTRDGIGTLITANRFEGLRPATIDDVSGILELIAPLEKQGILVRRSRELLELEINRFSIIERDGAVIACGALYTFSVQGPEHEIAELACLAVHPDYRNTGRGTTLFEYLEHQVAMQGIKRLFVLTTHTAHWFLERGFSSTELRSLPVKRQTMYNYQRKSKLYVKEIRSTK